MFDPLYKRTVKGGFVIWKCEQGPDLRFVSITYGQVNGNPTTTTKSFSSGNVSATQMRKTRDKKKAEGLYHTLSELGITHKEGNWYNYYSLNNLKMVARLSDALNAKLPPLGSTAKLPKQKPMNAEPIEMINLNVPITIHLPRI